MRWDDFAGAWLDIADRVRDRLEADQLVLLGTLRKDGSPRISPCEVDFAAGHLLLGMMWRSKKALNLMRDPRIVVHSLPHDKDGFAGDANCWA